MKIFKRLKHDAKEMSDAIFGFDMFRYRDYDNVDGLTSLTEVRKVKPIFGHCIILALNVGKIKVFKRSFIKI